MKDPLLKLHQVSAAYGHVRVLRGIDLSVDAGEVVCLLGRNGAGKTTAIRTICGLLPASVGTVRFAGRDITRATPMDIVGAGIATVPEGRRVFASLTVRENLVLGAFSRRRGRPDRTDCSEIYELFPRLAERANQRAGTLSGGEQQMLAMGRALMAKPRLLLLDEPSMGLAPILIEAVFDTIDRLARRGITVLLVEQNAVAALDVADRAYVLEHGHIVQQGLAVDLKDNEDVRRSYLGLT
jgi:branched-chain amino acid transport system ATP-binding protein